MRKENKKPKLANEYSLHKTFLINDKTGDIYELNKHTIKFLKCADGNHTVEQLTNKLGVNQTEVSKLIIYLKKKGIIFFPEEFVNKPVFHIQWHLSERCNLKCKHCYQGEPNCSNELDYQELIRFVDQYTYVCKKWKRRGEISLTGGEPFLLPFLESLCRYIKSGDIPINLTILTNGTLIKKKDIRWMKELGVRLQVSIDGNKTIHDEIRGKGMYKITLNNLQLLIGNNIPTSIHTVLMKKNMDCVVEIIKNFTEVGINRITFSRLVPLGRGIKKEMLEPLEVKEIFEKINQMSNYCQERKTTLTKERTLWAILDNKVSGICPVGYNTLTIQANGDILPCRRLPLIIGNIRKDSIFKVWYTNDILNNIRNRKQSKICGGCEFADKCLGCRGIAYAYFGDYMAPDPQCWLTYKSLPKIKN